MLVKHSMFGFTYPSGTHYTTQCMCRHSNAANKRPRTSEAQLMLMLKENKYCQSARVDLTHVFPVDAKTCSHAE